MPDAPVPEPEDRAGAPFDRGRLWIAVWAARRWLAAALLVGLVLAWPAARWLVRPTWVAGTSIVWERPPALVDEGEPSARDLRTMVDSVELPSSLATVRRRLGLRETVPELGATIDVGYDVDSNLVTVTARASSPRRAARVANTIVAVFLQHRRDVEAGRRRELVQALEQDLARAQAALSEHRRAYDAFRERHGISDLSVETRQAIELAASMRAEADLARADELAEDARARTLRSESRRVGATTVTETVVERAAPSTLEQTRLEATRAELAEARARLSAEHPTVRDLVAKVAALEASAGSASPPAREREASRVIRRSDEFAALQSSLLGAEAQRQVARERRRSYAELAAAAERELRVLSAVEGEASTLLARQRVAEAHAAELEALRARAIDAARSPATGLRVVAPAEPPEQPESRALQLAAVVLTPFVLVALALGTVLGRALRGLRAYTALEVTYWGAGPVVGSTTWPPNPDDLFELLDELDDHSPSAGGRTLVVGATPADDDAAGTVAFGLRELTSTALTSPAPAPLVPDPPAPLVRGALPSPPSTALARIEPPGPEELREDFAGASASRVARAVDAWRGPTSGPALRRAARLADRVLVVLRSGALSAAELARLPTRLGRAQGIGYLIIGLRPEHAALPDRAGSVESFWGSGAAPEPSAR